MRQTKALQMVLHIAVNSNGVFQMRQKYPITSELAHNFAQDPTNVSVRQAMLDHMLVASSRLAAHLDADTQDCVQNVQCMDLSLLRVPAECTEHPDRLCSTELEKDAQRLHGYILRQRGRPCTQDGLIESDVSGIESHTILSKCGNFKFNLSARVANVGVPDDLSQNNLGAHTYKPTVTVVMCTAAFEVRKICRLTDCVCHKTQIYHSFLPFSNPATFDHPTALTLHCNVCTNSATASIRDYVNVNLDSKRRFCMASKQKTNAQQLVMKNTLTKRQQHAIISADVAGFFKGLHMLKFKRDDVIFHLPAFNQYIVRTQCEVLDKTYKFLMIYE